MNESQSNDIPDLKVEGMPLDELRDAELKLGTVDGKRVLLVRRGEELFAVSAACTHYGGPLNKGLLQGDFIHCPWHHARFNLRTGEATRPPALEPLARWQVEVRSERAYVADRQLPQARSVTPPKQNDLRAIIIVGAGGAGSAAAVMLRHLGYQGRLTLIDHDADAPYDRPSLSKSFLAGDMPDLASLALHPPDFYADNDIHLLQGSVSNIDSTLKRLRLADGSLHEYDALLLTTGSEPRQLDIPGHDLPHVHVLRSFRNSTAIRTAARSAKQAVVLGASFIGLEVAASLRKLGVPVVVVAPDEIPLARVMGPELSRMIQQLHEENGVMFQLEQKPARIEVDAVILESGQRLPADLVVAGIGVTPRLELARQAGTDIEDGVLVDEFLETSVAGIYAAGDIAAWPDPHSGERIRVEHWALAQRAGQAAARNILGARDPFTAVPFFWSQHYKLSIRYTGHAVDWTETVIAGGVQRRDASVAFRKDGRTQAVASVKRDLENLEAEVALEADDEAALGALT